MYRMLEEADAFDLDFDGVTARKRTRRMQYVRRATPRIPEVQSTIPREGRLWGFLPLG